MCAPAVLPQIRGDRIAVVQQGEDLLIEIGPGASGPADRIEIRLNKASAREVGLAFGPSDWQAKGESSSILLSGPRLSSFPALFRVHIGKAKAPPVAHVVISLAGETVTERDVKLARLPPVTVSEGLEGLLAAPAIVFQGESVLARVLLTEATPAFGTWIVGNAQAQSAGQTVRLAIPPDASGLLQLPVRYVDALGRTTAQGTVLMAAEPSPDALPSSQLHSVQPIAMAGESLTVCGWFPPRARAAVLLDGRPGLKLAGGSVRSLVYTLPEETAPGRHLLSGDPAAGFPAKILELEIIRLDTTVDRAMRPPQVRISVRGTRSPVRLRVVNVNPLAASLEGGESQLVETDGGVENIATISMRPAQVRGPGAPNLRIVFALAAEAPACGAQNDATASPPTRPMAN